jgi:hypothetical protein
MIKNILKKEVKAWQMLIIYMLFVIAGLIGLSLSIENSFMHKISIALIFSGALATTLLVLFISPILFMKPARQK